MLILPTILAPHDWHHNGRISHDLHAEIEGRPESSGFFGGSSKSSRSSSPSPRDSRLKSAPLSITRQETFLPKAPPYTECDEDQSHDDWLKGTVKARRTVLTIYNPNPSGGVNSVNDRVADDVPSLGMYEVDFISDVVSSVR